MAMLIHRKRDRRWYLWTAIGNHKIEKIYEGSENWSKNRFRDEVRKELGINIPNSDVAFLLARMTWDGKKWSEDDPQKGERVQLVVPAPVLMAVNAARGDKPLNKFAVEALAEKADQSHLVAASLKRGKPRKRKSKESDQ